MGAFTGLFLLSLFTVKQHTTEYTGFRIIQRSEWGAEPSKETEKLTLPVSYVVIHHSYEPPACNTTDECKKSMRAIQRFHQVDQGWADIGYNIVIGGDGFAYIGRGFDVVGAHAPPYNRKSIGICLMGDWRTEKPSEEMLNATKAIIEWGIIKGYVHPKYKLFGHRQVRHTECPGDSLFKIISKWDHFSDLPTKE